MNILVVEDEEPSLNRVLRMLGDLAPGADITVGASRDEALSLVSDGEFDLILCDIRIPSKAASLDVAEEHGLAVHAHSRLICPGTPSIFLTAFGTSGATVDRLSQGGTADLYGLREAPVVQLASKDNREDVRSKVSRLTEAVQALEGTDSFEVLGDYQPSEMFIRAAVLYGIGINSQRCRIKMTNNGKSGAEVGRVEYVDADGQPAALYVKVAASGEIRDELERYHQYVPNRLHAGDFAPAMPPLMHGLRRRAALFSTIAAADTRSLFDLAADGSRSVHIINEIRDALSPWRATQMLKVVNVGELRRRRISDEKLREVVPPEDYDQLIRCEVLDIEMNHSVQHGDLHGANVLVGSADKPTLIDFGDVEFAPTALDPVTLMFSIVYHSVGAARGTGWPSVAQMEDWSNLDSLVHQSAFSPFLRQCRLWAEENCSLKEIAATVYAHSLRQLKYGDVDHRLALAAAVGAARLLAA